MHRFFRISMAVFLLNAFISAGFPQLRQPSEYMADRINLEHTYFVLYNSNEAGFGWGSEWTQTSSQNFEEKNALLLWHFKDGSIAYTRQGEYIGDFGMLRPYLMTEESKTLRDLHHNPIQPLTLENFPVKIELWTGEAGDPADFKPETLLDSVCLAEQKIEYGYAYYFFGCGQASAP
jgi:hypothetical protein